MYAYPIPDMLPYSTTYTRIPTIPTGYQGMQHPQDDVCMVCMVWEIEYLSTIHNAYMHIPTRYHCIPALTMLSTYSSRVCRVCSRMQQMYAYPIPDMLPYNIMDTTSYHPYRVSSCIPCPAASVGWCMYGMYGMGDRVPIHHP